MTGEMLHSPTLITESELVGRLRDGDADRVIGLGMDASGRRGGDPPADGLVSTIVDGGTEALVLVRSPALSRSCSALWAIALIAGTPVVRLPSDPLIAAWTVGHSVRLWLPGAGRCRALRAVTAWAAAVEAGHCHPSSPAPMARPQLLERWVDRMWRPCPQCSGGAVPGTSCGTCGLAPARSGVR